MHSAIFHFFQSSEEILSGSLRNKAESLNLMKFYKRITNKNNEIPICMDSGETRLKLLVSIIQLLALVTYLVGPYK